MANTFKDIIITPNRSSSSVDPKIEFRGGNVSVNTSISAVVYPESNGTLSFEGSAGQLFSITNDLTGTIFSVNDISGLPAIEIDANSNIILNQFAGNVSIGTTNTAAARLTVQGTVSPLLRLVDTSAGGDVDIQFIPVDSANTWTIGIDDSDADKFKIAEHTVLGTAKDYLTIDVTGRVGIGSSSPGYLLTVFGNANTGADVVQQIFNANTGTLAAAVLQLNSGAGSRYVNLQVNGNGQYYQELGSSVSTKYADFDTHIFRNSSGTERMRIDSTGNVAIGTTSPSYKFDVLGAGSTLARFVGSASTDALVRIIGANYATESRSRLFLGENDNNGMTFEYDGVANIGYIGMNDSIDPTGSWSKRIQMNRTGSEVSFMAGNVGIGTSSPGHRLDINGNTRIGTTSAAQSILHLTSSITGVSDIFFNDTADNRGVIRYDHTSDFMSFWSAGSERVRLNSTGNVAIGTNGSANRVNIRTSANNSLDGLYLDSPAGHWLHFRPAAAGGGNNGLVSGNDQAIIFSGPTQNSGSFIIAPWSGVNGGLKIDANGNVSIGTASTTFKFQVEGNAYVNGDISFNGGDLITTTSTTNVTNTNATTLNFAGAATTLRIGAATGLTTVSGNTTVRLKAYSEALTNTTISGTTNTYTADLSVTNIFDITLANANVRITFTNAPAANIAYPITLILRQPSTSANTVNFANTVYWSNGEFPVLSSGTANKIDILTLYTVNGGTIFYGAHALANVG